jgi:hypothetical protein
MSIAVHIDDLKLERLDLYFDINRLEKEILALEARLVVYDCMFTDNTQKQNKKRTWAVDPVVDENKNETPKRVRRLLE